MIEFRAVAEQALLVEFGDTIGESVHEAVLQLDRALAASPFEGFREAVPGYVNLLVAFDPLRTDHVGVESHLRALLSRPPTVSSRGKVREVLVCYGDELGRDLPEVARLTGLDTEAVIGSHLSGDYRVIMYGFAPGYAYLAGVPDAIRLPRKLAPLRGIPAGSVIIAGPQSLVTTLTMPTGWWIIGHSPTRILSQDPERPFLFDVGDTVRFRRIDRTEHDGRSRDVGTSASPGPIA